MPHDFMHTHTCQNDLLFCLILPISLAEIIVIAIVTAETEKERKNEILPVPFIWYSLILSLTLYTLTNYHHHHTFFVNECANSAFTFLFLLFTSTWVGCWCDPYFVYRHIVNVQPNRAKCLLLLNCKRATAKNKKKTDWMATHVSIIVFTLRIRSIERLPDFSNGLLLNTHT